jgi:hypothetical protein
MRIIGRPSHSATVDVARSFANSGVALGVRACLCAVTVNAASTMQMLSPATSDPNVRENGIGIRTFSFPT